MGLKDVTFCQNDLPRKSFDIFEDMRQNEELCDITIKMQNKTLTAHRVILAAGIPYFRSAFADFSLESEKKKTGLEELDPRAVESLINFAYTSRVSISLENVQSLLVASEVLQVSAVKEECVKFLSERLIVSNVVKVHTLAQTLNDTELTENCNRYIRQNFEEFYKSRDFLNLPYSFVVEIISKDDLRVSSEETVFKAVMSWVKASPSERKMWLLELLNEVRMVFHPKTQPRATRNGLYAVCYSSDHGYSIYHCELTKETWKKLTSKEADKGCVCHFTVTNEDMYLFFLKNIAKISLKTLFWQDLEPTHEYILGSAVSSHGNILYVFGSNTANFMNKIRCFDIRREMWLKENKMMVTSRSSSAAASLEQSIYITGGLDWTKHHGCISVLRTVEKFSPSTGQSSQIASMILSRHSHGCTSMNGKLFVCGGLQSEAIGNIAEVYDPATDQWNCMASMNRERYNFSLLSENGKIYAVGGISGHSLIANDFEIYNQETNNWNSGFAMPGGFQHAALVLSNRE